MIRDFDEMSQLFSQMDRTFESMQDGTSFGTYGTPMLEGDHAVMRDGDRPRVLESDRTEMRDDQPRNGQHRDNRTLDGRRSGREGMTNLVAEDGEYVFIMDLPGYETEEIDLVFHEGVLKISRSTELTDETETTSVRHSRRTNESVRIPGEVDVENIDASYHDGVLEVSLPMLEADADDGHVIDLR